MKAAAPAILLFVLVPEVPLQDDRGEAPFQARVDLAIARGVAFLKGKRTAPFPRDMGTGDELILLALLLAGVPESDPDVRELLKHALEARLEKTYKVTLTAMCLEELDRVKYQRRLHQCAQFLADNIGPGGQTGYGTPSPFADEIGPSPAGGPEVAPPEGPRPPRYGDVKPKGRLISVRQRRAGPTEHDRSNMQFAALGLLACHQANILIEPELLHRVSESWRRAKAVEPGAVEEPLQLSPPPGRTKSWDVPPERRGLFKAAPAGWGYRDAVDKPCGSMTAGAVAALSILDFMLGRDWREDKEVLQGFQWLHKNFSVTENPGRGREWQYYYLYSLARAGTLYGTEFIGKHQWYREVAGQILKDQKEDGGWGQTVPDTCFALLALWRRRVPMIICPER